MLSVTRQLLPIRVDILESREELLSNKCYHTSFIDTSLCHSSVCGQGDCAMMGSLG